MAEELKGYPGPGTCCFCGEGDGYLGEQGDETSENLHSAVRKGEPGKYTYERHPNAEPDQMRGQTMLWCGTCVRGLIHKWQRYDDTNLRALFLSSKLRLELDGLRWVGWEVNEGKERDAVKPYLDDPAIHMDKLRLERDVNHLQMETFRRYGHDITQMYKHWRP